MTGKPDPAPERRRAEARGRTAEMLAAMLLRVKGYRIVAERYRTPVGEVDIVAKRGDLVAFIEVKARASHTDALESITPRQRRRIEAAAEAWLQDDQASQDCAVRFDVITVAPRMLPTHMMDAWRPGD